MEEKAAPDIGDDHVLSVEKRHAGETIILRVSMPLSFANAESFHDKVKQLPSHLRM